MKKYHFNRSTGRTGVCSAQKKCRLDLPMDEHYDSPEAARAGFETTQAGLETTTLSRKTKIAVSSAKVVESIETVIKTSFESLPKFDSKETKTFSDFEKSDSNVKCPECHTPVIQQRMDKLLHFDRIHCDNGDCDELFDLEGTEINVEDEFADIEYDTKNVLKRTWFHSTTRENWEKGIRDESCDTVHLGSPMAAVDRGLIECGYQSEFHLYEVELVDDAVIHNKIVDDEIDFSFLDTFSNEQQKGFEETDVRLYLNRWEHPGSVSLAVRPQKIRVVGTQKISKKDAKKVLTVYNIF